MTPQQLFQYLSTLIEHRLHHSVMIWGAPGIGKSSVVRQVAQAQQIGFIDLRLSQLAPTDLRGVPVPRDGVTAWYPPEFLPRDGSGILFLDEINLAPPVLQGVAQQLVLDREVGSYQVPPGWFVWAAGNRAEDRAAIFDMPSPLANRFLHLPVEAHLESFRRYAHRANLHEHIIGFLNFRPSLLHKMDSQSNAWPSPRSWSMADGLLKAGLDVVPAVGAAAAAEFKVFQHLAAQIPGIERIVSGKSTDVFPAEPSLQYALTSGIVSHVKNREQALSALRWLIREAPPEWVQLAAVDLFPKMRDLKVYDEFRRQLLQDAELSVYLDHFAALAS
ncbi:MAG TPA: MoxR family ATPase [Pseudoduganella sp.]